MDFLRREKAALGYLARGLAVVGKALFAGQTRRRITLAASVSIGLIGYLWVGWGLDALLESLLGIIFGVPAPGRPLAPSTWLAPTNGLWPDVMLLSRAAMGLSSVILVGLLARATMASDTAVQRAEIKRVARAGLMVGATWTVIPFGLHLSNEIATGLAPDPDVLLDAVAATAGGTFVLGIVTWLQPLFVAVAVIATIVLRGLIFVGFVAWPLAWPLRALDTDLSHTFGRSITAVFTVAVVAKVVQALGAFLVIFLSITIDSLPVRVLVFVVGMIAVFVALPIVMIRHAERVMMLPGALAPRERQMQQFVQESADRVGQVHKQLQTGRERVSEWRTPTDSRDIFAPEFDDWRADASDDTDAGWFGGFSGGDLGAGWFERSSDDRWWNGWIRRAPNFHTSEAWKRSLWERQRTPADGRGSESDGPEDSGEDSHTDTTTRGQSWQDRR